MDRAGGVCMIAKIGSPHNINRINTRRIESRFSETALPPAQKTAGSPQAEKTISVTGLRVRGSSSFSR